MKTKTDPIKNIGHIFNELWILLKITVDESKDAYKRCAPVIYFFCLWQISFTIIHCLGIDLKMWRDLQLLRPLIHIMPLYKILMFCGCYFLYGLYKFGQLNVMRRALSRAFIEAGMVTITGRKPEFISIKVINSQVFEMRFSTNGVPISKFKDEKAKLESSFFYIIDNIEEDADNSQVAVVRFATKPLQRNVKFSDVPKDLPPNTIPLGVGRSQFLTTTLTANPHILIGGTSNMGKSSYLRFLITYMLTHFQETDIWHVDLKEGSEAAPFEGANNYRSTHFAKTALTWIEELLSKVKERMEFFTTNKMLSVEDFQKKFNSADRSTIKWSDKIKSDADLKRIVLIVDEAMSLFLTHSTDYSGQDAVRARSLMQELGAKARAAGIHLILATQRPDRHTIDMNIKTHMAGRVAFSMSDAATSMTILDTADAAKLIRTPGRAIWSTGLYNYEMQVPHVTADEARAKLKEYGAYDKKKPSKIPVAHTVAASQDLYPMPRSSPQDQSEGSET